jgi:carboxylesterase
MVRKAFGVLILHGFASSLDSINLLETPLTRLNLPVRMPVLRGHGAETPEALHGVTWRDWVSDSEAALRRLLKEVEQAIVIGHSMGALLALTLSANNRESIDSLVLVAPAIELKNPLAPHRPLNFLLPAAERLVQKVPMPAVYADRALAGWDTNYRWAPMDATRSFIEFSEVTRARLKEVDTPVLVLQSRRDSTISTECVDILRAELATPRLYQKVKWFHQSEHEMLRDCEREQVIEVIVDYVMERVG